MKILILRFNNRRRNLSNFNALYNKELSTTYYALCLMQCSALQDPTFVLARGCVWVITWDISRGSQLHDAETTVFLCKIQCWENYQWWIDIHTEMCRSCVLEGSALLCMYWGREIPCMSDNWPWSSFLHWSGPETIDPLYKLALQERSQFDCVSRIVLSIYVARKCYSTKSLYLHA